MYHRMIAIHSPLVCFIAVFADIYADPILLSVVEILIIRNDDGRRQVLVIFRFDRVQCAILFQKLIVAVHGEIHAVDLRLFRLRTRIAVERIVRLCFYDVRLFGAHAERGNGGRFSEARSVTGICIFHAHRRGRGVCLAVLQKLDLGNLVNAFCAIQRFEDRFFVLRRERHAEFQIQPVLAAVQEHQRVFRIGRRLVAAETDICLIELGKLHVVDLLRVPDVQIERVVPAQISIVRITVLHECQKLRLLQWICAVIARTERLSVHRNPVQIVQNRGIVHLKVSAFFRRIRLWGSVAAAPKHTERNEDQYDQRRNAIDKFFRM